MRATNWEFKYRALVFGLIFALAFSLYKLDPQNATAALANWLSAVLGLDANLVARLLFVLATCILVVAALTRTWASAYLRTAVVYAAEVKTESLVADGPYRYVRNPLYLGNILLALGLGAMMSRVGFVAIVIAMTIFGYRLIFREEYDLRASQGEQYRLYQSAVPRLWPAWTARVPAAGREANWAEGFKAEFLCWGFVVSVGVFAFTLSTTLFFGAMWVSVAVLWLSSSLVSRR